MLDAVKKKSYTTHFGIMVGDAVKGPVEPPGNKGFRLFKLEMLVGHQRQDGIGGESIRYLIDHYSLVAMRICTRWY